MNRLVSSSTGLSGEEDRTDAPGVGRFFVLILGCLLLWLGAPTLLWADSGEHLEPHFLSVIPFIALLLCVAALPLISGHWWHENMSKILVAAALALPVTIYLVLLDTEKHTGTAALVHELLGYFSFIVLLGSLYVVSGGIVLTGDLRASPLRNTLLLALGAALANLIGTTGSSMLLIRPLLRMNKQRQSLRHLVVFFIFSVSNLGGLLTPLGDPPLFLGFLKGVPFSWTLQLWPQWLFANGIVLSLFFVWDTLAFRKEPSSVRNPEPSAGAEPLRIRGTLNFLFLVGILVAVLFQSKEVGQAVGQSLSRFFPCPDLTLGMPYGEFAMIAMGLLSLWVTPRELRKSNGFTWAPITEVAIIFAGLFVTMVPALELLKTHGKEFGITQPWQYFWLTGVLSSFLDNAPTYLAFATMASGSSDLGGLASQSAMILKAISCGAVFMGANTYIGNGPNFMVKAIADEADVKTPSFFGYMLYSTLILMPIWVLVTFVFFG